MIIYYVSLFIFFNILIQKYVDIRGISFIHFNFFQNRACIFAQALIY